MSDTSRKVKNPLLSAAAVGFPFEDFSGNAVLMPVTPATSSVLQDEGEIASFVGQQPPPPPSSYPAEFNVGSAARLDHQQQYQNQQSAPATAEINLSPINEPGDSTASESAIQPQKQGYLSSLLSSLPNLSLASITGDNREDSTARISAVPDYNSYPSNYPPSSYSTPPYQSGNVGPSPGRQENPYELGATTASWYQPNNSAAPAAAAPLFTPPASQPPPAALPPTGAPSSSYRLGNQRRLKYAPPPDLTTSSPRVSGLSPPTPLVPQPAFSPAAPPTVYQPQLAPSQVPPLAQRPESQNAFPSEQRTLSQSIKPPISEPATPQNTPANPTPLSTFAPPTPGRDWGPGVDETRQDSEDDALRDVDLREPSPSASLPVPSAPEVGFTPENNLPSSSSSPFAPISAARVSEKLEHLLATRKELSPKVTERESLDFGGEKLDSTLVSSTAAYFAPTLDRPASNSNFYDPTKFQAEIQPLAGTPAPPSTTSTLPQPSAVPSFYNPSQFSTPADPQPQLQTQSLSVLESFAPVYNPQSYFYPPASNAALPDDPLGSGNSHENPASYFTPPSPPMGVAVPEPTGSATLDPIQMSVNPLGSSGHANTFDSGLPNLPPSLHNLAAGTSAPRQMTYRPVYQHWFHRKEVETKVLWLPFSMQDSLNLEQVHNSTEITPETTVATEGGRYDVDILRRLRTPVYWSGAPNEVRRCSWFYKGPTESRYVPYEESVAARLEEEYQQACNTDAWGRRIELNNGEHIIFHSPTVQVHYLQPGSPEPTTSWGSNSGSEDSAYLQGTTLRPRVVKRGVDEFNIDEGEPEQVDHLLFLVHGIGSVCDLKFRSVEEVVDEFRSISLQLVQSHYRTASEQGIVHKMEVLPISWHTTLHSEDTGIDKKLQAITLDSIPKLRYFTNDTLSDILFYTSPIYCQTIMQTVGHEMNRLYALFKKRNPTFDGGVYLGGHSLGSLILFDLLCHQKPPKNEEEDTIKEKLEEEKEPGDEAVKDDDVVNTVKEPKAKPRKSMLSRKISYVMGSAGTGQPYINYPQLHFHPSAFFALGSPIGMFVTVRGIDTLGEDFALPTCPAFFNIFHPFDPVAYRIEALIHPDASKFRPKLIPHHKGRKRMHLELKETMARVGADLKHKLLDSVRSTWNSVYQLAMFHRSDNQALEQEIDKVVEEQLNNASSEPVNSQVEDSGDDIKIGKLNGGRRVDYVLQEAPFEYINEYIFALTSHVCYWESEDTMLMMLKEIYGSMGIQSDAQLPQQTLTIERAPLSTVVMPRANQPAYTSNPGTSAVAESSFDGKSTPVVMGMDPTAPISERPVGPPPTTGFLRKS
ncbi:SEC23-interacting protein isoform X1 [Neodiprion pinetum]|uniref:SEC23-interacting protein isoform X1 n=1 Tax=Neodiprion pinetum TaxID=441929 RepID=UPI001EDD0C81|nr:SEC23-interacting protein-like [Neodiprion pinetum]XP_046489221.1 SEC23-interacting protein-like [Neodiprion pinetum]XP_046489222.1 SEC23-interacting protein-like [Neodiprion pinetum]XP_046489223.1 SEC23-interacting protein-like [Neodiprion pinetum]XP_046489224.1 SEC23-interacting protein-like [Neodiprion pinetum]XP_046489225.1 SEC23-interacting protein-like [Neodiprion pinetum]